MLEPSFTVQMDAIDAQETDVGGRNRRLDDDGSGEGRRGEGAWHLHPSSHRDLITIAIQRRKGSASGWAQLRKLGTITMSAHYPRFLQLLHRRDGLWGGGPPARQAVTDCRRVVVLYGTRCMSVTFSVEKIISWRGSAHCDANVQWTGPDWDGSKSGHDGRC